MTNLTKNLRTYIVYIKEWDNEVALQITNTQYLIIREDIENLKFNDFYKITDIDSWKILFDWQRKDILRFKEKKISASNYKVICYYWNKHNIINWKFHCDCEIKYWFSAIDFKIWANENWKSIYMQDLTEEDRIKCWLNLKK